MKKKFKIIINIFILTIILLGIISTAFYYTVYFKNFNKEIEYSVEKGDTLIGFLKKLEKEEFLVSYIPYYIYFKIFRNDIVLKTGVYHFFEDDSLYDLIEKVQKGNVNLVSITIPPGLSLKEIGLLLEKESIMTYSEFNKVIENPKFIEKWDSIIKLNLEGYIYPETYKFEKELRPETIISIFIDHYFEQLNNLIDITKYSKKELYNKLIIASLIEEEAIKTFEMPIISSVIYNRLHRNMRLELCPTVQYVLGKHKERLLFKDLEVKSPYNTYLNQGLPPSPIANPSLEAIKAAFFPDNTEYLFYVAKGDGTHYFSKTYDEHLKKKKIAEKDRDF